MSRIRAVRSHSRTSSPSALSRLRSWPEGTCWGGMGGGGWGAGIGWGAQPHFIPWRPLEVAQLACRQCRQVLGWRVGSRGSLGAAQPHCCTEWPRAWRPRAQLWPACSHMHRGRREGSSSRAGRQAGTARGHTWAQLVIKDDSRGAVVGHCLHNLLHLSTSNVCPRVDLQGWHTQGPRSEQRPPSYHCGSGQRQPNCRFRIAAACAQPRSSSHPPTSSSSW